MRISFKITTTDGETDEVKVRPSALLAFERDGNKMGDESQPVTSLYLLAYYAVGKPGDDFDAWVDTLDDLESVTEGDEELPTTAG